jgi:ABC-type Na+ efflux pump permease subunit
VSFLLASALKDLRRRRGDPLALVLWAGIPLMIGLLMKLAFGGDGSTPTARLLVADQDDTLVSRLLVGAFDQGELAELVDVEAVEAEAGRARLESGGASALLVIPEGFGSAVLRERPVALSLLTNPAQRILPGIVEEVLDTLVDAVFYLQRLLRGPIQQVIEGPPAGAATFPDSTVSSVSVTINRLVERLEPYLFPPAIELETSVAGGGDAPEQDFGELFFPGMLVLALLFMAQGLSEDVWKERSQGTLRRVLTTPQRLSDFLAGKLLAGAALVAALSLVGLAAARWILGIELANLPLALLWVTFAGTAMLALLVLVQLHATSERGGNLLTGFVIFPLAMAGGSFFPFEIMPGWLARVGRLTPNGWALTQLEAILRGEVEPGALAAALAGVLAVGGAAFALSARRLRRGFAQG